MALPAPIQALFDRLKAYNGSAYNPQSNPRGFARGGNQQGVFVAALQDVAEATKAVSEIGAEVGADADRFVAAVAAIEAGPVTSVNGQSGIVVVDTSALQDQVDEKLAEVDALVDYRSPFTFAYAFR